MNAQLLIHENNGRLDFVFYLYFFAKNIVIEKIAIEKIRKNKGIINSNLLLTTGNSILRHFASALIGPVT